MSGFSFVTPVLESPTPMDILLALIQKSEVNIYDIPISEITDQFIAYIHSDEAASLGDLSDFYKMAADLLYIKSRMMLPVSSDNLDDEEYDDPRQELVQKLIDYQKFKKYSQILFEQENSDFTFQRRESEFSVPFSDAELFDNVNLSDLFNVFSSLMQSAQEENDSLVFGTYEEVTVGQKTAYLLELLERKAEVTFTAVVDRLESREHIITAFLALLECLKDRMIRIRQDNAFGEIFITKNTEESYE